jgi:hypothetical protein
MSLDTGLEHCAFANPWFGADKRNRLVSRKIRAKSRDHATDEAR